MLVGFDWKPRENCRRTSLISEWKVKAIELSRLVRGDVPLLVSQSRALNPSTPKVGGWIFPQKLLKGFKQPGTALLYQINTLKKYYERRVKVLSMNPTRITSLVSQKHDLKFGCSSKNVQQPSLSPVTSVKCLRISPKNSGLAHSRHIVKPPNDHDKIVDVSRGILRQNEATWPRSNGLQC